MRTLELRSQHLRSVGDVEELASFQSRAQQVQHYRDDAVSHNVEQPTSCATWGVPRPSSGSPERCVCFSQLSLNLRYSKTVRNHYCMQLSYRIHNKFLFRNPRT
jgi:hypothetical protein